MKFLLLLLVIIMFSCDKILLGDDEQLITLQENLQAPAALNDDWEVSTLAAQNIQPEPIQNLIKNIQSDPKNIHSLLIFRNNKLVSESYFDGWHRSRLHALRSDSKSFISTLMGIAIDKGQIKNVEQKVVDFFPEYADLNTAQKMDIKIKDILTMTSGLQWDESTYPLDDYRNDEYAIERSDDRLRYLLKKEVAAPAGTHFLYNSGLPILVSALLKKSTGNTADVFAKKNLFEPLNIKNYFWRMNTDGYVAVAPLFLIPRDMGKLGQLFLDSGKWKGKQIISSDWVRVASSTIVENTSSFPRNGVTETGYGYNWWTEKFTVNNKNVQVYAAEGSGGQYIFVVPSLNAVVVFTGGNYTSNQNTPFGMMQNVILPNML